MCSSCKGKAYQIEQSRDGVNDEKGGERGASAGGDTEVGLGAIIAEAFICKRFSLSIFRTNGVNRQTVPVL